MKKYTSILLLLVSFFSCLPSGSATVWTTIASGPVTTLANWSDGTTSPTSFATPGDTWRIAHVMTMTGSWSAPASVWSVGTVSAAPSTVEIIVGGVLKLANDTTIIIVNGDFAVNGGKVLRNGNSYYDSMEITRNFTLASDSFAIKGTVPKFRMNVGGDFLMSAGRFYFSATSGTQFINVGGNFTLSGGNFSQSGNTTTKNLDILGDFTMSADTFSFTGTIATVNLSVHGNAFVYGGVVRGGKLYMNVTGSMLNAGLIAATEQTLNCGDLTIMGTTNCGKQTTSCHDLTVNAGSIVASGTAASMTYTVNGTATMTSASVTVTGTGPTANMHIFGDCNITAGSYYLSATGGNFVFNTNGNFSLNGGLFQTAGNTANFIYNVYGNCSISGPAVLTNGSAHGANELHLALPESSGTMLINNICTGTWTKTNIYVDTVGAAQLNGNFNLPVSGSYGMIVNGKLICPASHSLYGSGTFQVNGVASLYTAHPGGINGSVTSTGTRTFNPKANYIFNGTTPQLTGTYLPVSLQSPGTLSIDNPAGVTLSQNTATTGTLAFINGVLHTGTFAITTPGTASAVTGAGAANYVEGRLVKTIAGTTSITYEVGGTSYRPMTLVLNSAGTAGSLGVRCKDGLHPSIATSLMLTGNMVNGYWSVSNTAAAGPATIIPVATYNPGDILGGSNTSFVAQKYSGSTWLAMPLTTSNTATPYTSATIAGIALTSLKGDYVFGNSCGSPITGTTNICTVGGSTALSNATPGGTWSSSDASVATVSAFGAVTALSSGTAIVYYSTASCSVSVLITAGVSAIVGPASVCPSSSIALSNSTPGGIWTSGSPAIATISATGNVYAVSGGTTAISYTVGGCAPVTHAVNVTTLGGITGSSSVYTGSSVALSNATPGGTWTSSNVTTATVSASGVVYGVAAGTTTISYVVGSCFVTFPVTVVHHYLIVAHSITSPPDSLCTSPKFYISVNGFSSLLRLKTYYGDGTTDSIPLIPSSGSSYANATHAYTTPGCYSVKQVLYFNNIPHDSVLFTYHHLYCRTLALKIYMDVNNDCIRNTGEGFNTTSLTVRVDSAGIPVALLPATSGIYYKAKGLPGTIYSFNVAATGIVFPSCPASGVIYDTVPTAAASYVTKYIGLNCNASPDFDLLVLPSMRCGTHAGIINIIARNTYCTAENATLTLNLTPKYQVGGPIVPAPISVAGNSIKWLFNSLSSSSLPVNIHLSLHTPTMLTIGDTVHDHYSITPVAGDVIPGNNNVDCVDTLKGGFDPNYIDVTPPGCFEDDTQFQYTIHFENTGNDTAHNIYVMDTLGDYVDMSSLKILAATADMDVYVTTDEGFNVIKFDFPNIKLLDSSHHGLCDGAVAYTINRKMTMPNGAKLTNKASIYFDFNPAVMTNTAENQKGCPHPVAIQTVTAEGATLFPNPTTHTITIKTTQQEYTTYTITNSIGQTLMQQSLTGAQTTGDVHMLPAGVYYVTLRGSGAPVTLKFVKM